MQRVPFGDTRRHTSTVTVAAVDVQAAAPGRLDAGEVELITYRGSGPGGQHRNTSDTAVRARHLPTGLEAKSEAQRSWWRNREAAVAELTARVVAEAEGAAATQANAQRVAQIGAGARVAHDWTWCAWRDSVTHHPTGRSWSMAAALRGRW